MMDPKDIIKEIKETYREECYSVSQKYFWIRQIKCGLQDFSDLPKPGRPVDGHHSKSFQQKPICISKIGRTQDWRFSYNCFRSYHQHNWYEIRSSSTISAFFNGKSKEKTG